MDFKKLNLDMARELSYGRKVMWSPLKMEGMIAVTGGKHIGIVAYAMRREDVCFNLEKCVTNETLADLMVRDMDEDLVVPTNHLRPYSGDDVMRMYAIAGDANGSQRGRKLWIREGVFKKYLSPETLAFYADMDERVPRGRVLAFRRDEDVSNGAAAWVPAMVVMPVYNRDTQREVEM